MNKEEKKEIIKEFNLLAELEYQRAKSGETFRAWKLSRFLISKLEEKGVKEEKCPKCDEPMLKSGAWWICSSCFHKIAYK